MGENNLKIRIKHRYDTEANWNKNNPVLLSGEVAISSDKSGKHKVGDGTHKWSELSYAKAELTKGDVTGALGYTPPAKDTWRGIQNNLISTATDQSLSAAQGKWLNENKATITTLTNGNLDKVTTPGFYNAGGGNSVTNKPSGVDNFGMIVVHSASGNYYTQIVYVDDKSYRRVCRNGTWGNWSQDILTDTIYTHPGYTAKSSGLYKITVDGTGHVSATTAVTKSDITALGIPGQDTNTTYSTGTSSTPGLAKLYTGTGSATDGTMTQNAITTALNGKSATGHTHNYAGSSSVGGNANAAVKLATARKIGSASFDGTTDITLSQMGVINPIELTRAEYEDLIVNNRIDDNQYYNVIDDYDSDILINDSSVSKKYVYSSDKTEKTYSKRSTTSTVTLSASTWSGSSAPYSYVLSVAGVTATNIIEINYASSASDAAIEAYQGAGLKDGGQSAGRITLLATEKPTVNIPITIIVRNDL